MALDLDNQSDAGAQKLANRISGDMATLRTAPQALAAVILQLRATRHAINGDKMVSRLAISDRTKAANEQAEKAIEDAVDRAQSARASVERDIDKALGHSVPEPQVLAAAMHIATAQLDAPKIAPEDAVRQLVASRIPGMPDALRTLLPLYAARAGGDEREAKQRGEKLLAVLDQAEAPNLPAVEQFARAVRDELVAGFANLTTDRAFAAMEIAGTSRSDMWAAWERGQGMRIIAPNTPVPQQVDVTQGAAWQAWLKSAPRSYPELFKNPLAISTDPSRRW